MSDQLRSGEADGSERSWQERTPLDPCQAGRHPCRRHCVVEDLRLERHQGRDLGGIIYGNNGVTP
ncbi:hypothetical protein SynA1544_01798 [Synechococcus sp. A15-44]|nr:hypothetical protein SynA1544_01798 [Synechococcus sp. A15-44]